jgi:hypothetical protein
MNFRIAVSRDGKIMKVQFQAMRDKVSTAAIRRAFDTIRVIKGKTATA